MAVTPKRKRKKVIHKCANGARKPNGRCPVKKAKCSYGKRRLGKCPKLPCKTGKRKPNGKCPKVSCKNGKRKPNGKCPPVKKCKYGKRETNGKCPKKNPVAIGAKLRQVQIRRIKVKNVIVPRNMDNVPIINRKSKMPLQHFQDKDWELIFYRKARGNKEAEKVLHSATSIDNLCRGIISPEYARSLGYKRNTSFIVARNAKNKIVGFVLLALKKTDLYIELVCSNDKGLGSILMKRVELVANKFYDVEYVTLSAVDEAVPFYSRLGYQQTGKYRSLKPMTLPVKLSTAQKSANQTLRRKAARQRRIRARTKTR